MSSSNGHTQEIEAPTLGVEWRKPREQGFLKVMPSGNKAYLRPITPAALMEHMGEIPDHLTPIVSEMIFGGITHAKVLQLVDAMGVDAAQDSLKRAARSVEFANTLCKIAFVNPKVVDNPQAEDEIAPGDIELADRFFVLTLAMQPVEVLRSFRWEQSADVEDVPDSQDPEPAPQPVDGDS
jgi:hypothetical protein